MLNIDYLEHQFGLRQILVLCAANSIPVKFNNVIQSEISTANLKFMKLLSILSPNCEFNFTKKNDKTGNLIYKPSILIGGNLSFDCGSLSIGYFLEYIICLLPICKHETQIKITGITNDNKNLSVDYIKHVLIRNFERFTGMDKKELRNTQFLDLNVYKRSSTEIGDGEVILSCKIIKQYTPFVLTDIGKVNRIRGVISSVKLAPETSNRVLYSVREALNRYIPDIYINTDIAQGKKASEKPGYGVMLYAETTTGIIKGTEVYAESGDVPEDIGRKAALELLNEISNNGCFDRYCESFMIHCAALCPKDIFKMQTSKHLSFNSAYNLRAIYETYGIKYRLEKVETDDREACLITGAGIGISNISRKIA